MQLSSVSMLNPLLHPQGLGKISIQAAPGRAINSSPEQEKPQPPGPNQSNAPWLSSVTSDSQELQNSHINPSLKQQSQSNSQTPAPHNYAPPHLGMTEQFMLAPADFMGRSQDTPQDAPAETPQKAGSPEQAASAEASPLKSKEASEQGSGSLGQQLTPEEQAQVKELQARDREVRAHEQAHIAAGGSAVSGGASYTYQRGPDGRNYAVGGEVGIDASAVADDPQATIQKAQTVKRAALAPAQPSAQDRQVAAQAAQMETQARAELAKEKMQANSEAGDQQEETASASAPEQTPDQSGSAAPASRQDSLAAPETAARQNGIQQTAQPDSPVPHNAPGLKAYGQQAFNQDLTAYSTAAAKPMSIYA